MTDVIEKLKRVGFSEYEAKAYLALLKKSPVTGYELAKTSGVPRSMIYEVLDKLTANGAALLLCTEQGNRYAPAAADEFLDQALREKAALVADLKESLSGFTDDPDLDYVWNLEGQGNIISKAVEMIARAERRIYLALLPETMEALRDVLEQRIKKGVKVVIYTTEPLILDGGRVMVALQTGQMLDQARGIALILVIDGREVLIGEWLSQTEAHASWTSSPLLVFIAEHHLRTDLYLPEIISQLGEEALEIIHEEDRELFSHAMESHLDDVRSC